jgi:hypothetical protein
MELENVQSLQNGCEERLTTICPPEQRFSEKVETKQQRASAAIYKAISELGVAEPIPTSVQYVMKEPSATALISKIRYSGCEIINPDLPADALENSISESTFRREFKRILLRDFNR